MLFKKTKEQKMNIARLENNRRIVKKQRMLEKTMIEETPSSFVSFKNIQKVYPNGVHSVIDFNLDINQGEFIVFVGPSGCGKTTTIRMVCGLEEISAGRLYINGIYSNDLEPSDRGVSMVFQNYALFPHLSVYENIAYGLKIKKIEAPLLDKNHQQVIGINQRAIRELQKEKNYILKNFPNNLEDIQKIDHDIQEYLNNPMPLTIKRKLTKEEIDVKVQKAAEILNLSDLLERKPNQLSGGQCQRVALGRVIVSDAKLLLMDEPLSNLDAKLRTSMRGEILNLHKSLNATTIYVTHDQVEAMTMASRIVVMKKGLIQQIGTPKELYNHPNCLFVATFIGSPTMNILSVFLKNNEIAISDYKMKYQIESKLNTFYHNELKLEHQKLLDLPNSFEGELLEEEKNIILNRIEKYETVLKEKKYPLKLGIRSEDISLSKTKKGIKGIVSSIELFGSEQELHLNIQNETIVLKCSSQEKFAIGDTVYCQINQEKMHLFDTISEKCVD